MPEVPVLSNSPVAGLYAALPPFSCSWVQGCSDAAWVHVTGEVDLATSPELSQTLHDAQLYATLVVLDLREVSFIESSGVHVILDAAGEARDAGGRLILLCGPVPLEQLLTLTGVCEQLEIVDLHPAEPAARALLSLTRGSART